MIIFAAGHGADSMPGGEPAFIARLENVPNIPGAMTVSTAGGLYPRLHILDDRRNSQWA